MSAQLSVRKRLRRIVLYTTVALLVTAAVLMSLLRLVITDVETYRLDIEKVASTFLEQPVRIEALDARFSGLTPTLVFRNVRLLDKTGKHELVRFDEARLGIAVWASLRAEKVVPAEFVIENVHLAITRLKNGNINIQGIDIQKLGESAAGKANESNGGLADWLFHRARLALRHSTVLWHDLHGGGARRKFDDVNIILANDGNRHRLKGALGLPEALGRRLELGLDIEGDMTRPDSWSGQIYARGDGINLHEWQQELPVEREVKFKHGTLDLKLWGELDDGKLVRLSGDSAVYNVELQAPLLRDSLSLNMAGALFDFRREGENWQAVLDRMQLMSANSIWPASRLSVIHRAGSGDQPPELDIRAEYFRIEDVSRLLFQTTLLDKEVFRQLQTMQPSGDVRQLRMRAGFDGKLRAPYHLAGNFRQLAFEPYGKLPGAHGLNGSFWLDDDRARLQLESDYATLNLPRLFRSPLTLTRLQTVLDWQRLSPGWQLWTDSLVAETRNLKTRSRLQLDDFDNGSSPYLDMQSRFSATDASQAPNYFPVGIMNPGLVAWLDQALLGGDVPAGAMVFNGRLKAFPFQHGEGRFLTRFETEKLDLRYKEGWPLIRQVRAEAEFSGTGMSIEVARGQLFKSRLGPARIRIPQFRQAELHVEGRVEGGLDDVAHFLTASPIAPGAREFVSSNRITGKARTRIRFHMPLSKKAAPLAYEGEVKLEDAALYLLDDRIDITNLDGQLSFSEKGEFGRGLHGRIMGEPARFEVFALPQDGRLARSIVATTRQDMARLMVRLGFRPGKRVSGKTDVQAVLVLAPDSNGKVRPVLNISSSLEGVQLNMPLPLQKPPGAVRSLAATLKFQPQQTELLFNYDDRLCAALNLRHNDVHGVTVHFGAGVPRPPKGDVLKLTGVVDDFSYTAWRALLTEVSPAGKARAVATPIELDMQRLGLRKTTPGKKKENLTPAQVPLVNGTIREFVYDGMRLGRLRLETARLRYGMRIKKLRLNGPNLQLRAKGNWIHRRKSDTTTLEVAVQSPDTGKMLGQLGYAVTIRQGKLQATGTISWPDRPDRFDLSKLVGNVRLSLKNGSLTEIQPGAGRLLGLFSLSALPRRLTLDFRDTFKSGFSFDEIKGELDIRNGSVHARQLVAESPVAEIIIQGRTDYIAKTLDQTVIVIPKVSETLPVAGGLLFGLQVGAAIAVLNKIMGKEIDKATTRRYRITGSWDKPVITEIVEPGKAAVSENEPE
jgi:uncharacterized protein (TIGR02099 family)